MLNEEQNSTVLTEIQTGENHVSPEVEENIEKIAKILDVEIRDLFDFGHLKTTKELKNELFKLRFQNSLNGLDNPKKITLVKKEIARVNTVLTEKENN